MPDTEPDWSLKKILLAVLAGVLVVGALVGIVLVSYVVGRGWVDAWVNAPPFAFRRGNTRNILIGLIVLVVAFIYYCTREYGD